MLKKKIIATVTNDLAQDQRMIRICNSLQQAGYQVLLLGRLKKNSKPLVNRSFQQKRLYCFFQKGKWFYLEYNLRLTLFLLFKQADIFNAVDLDTILPNLIAAKLKRKKLVYDAHEYFTEVPEVIRRPAIKKIWERIAAFAVPKVDLAYTVGPQLAKIMGKRYDKNFEVIRNLPLQQNFPLTKPNNESKIILYQGMLNEGRGLEQFILAMHHIENAVFWLVGSGDLMEELQRLVKKEALEEKVIFKGFVPPDQLREYTIKADLGINLLENTGLSYYYSLANKALDYIQAGLPSLQMNYPEYAHINGQYNCFVLLNELEPDDIAKCVNSLLEINETYHQISKNCLSAAKTLNWEQEQLKLFDIYKGLN
ncbi:MAG: glycosyltransferase [Bacteroidota bacterium]